MPLFVALRPKGLTGSQVRASLLYEGSGSRLTWTTVGPWLLRVIWLQRDGYRERQGQKSISCDQIIPLYSPKAIPACTFTF